MINKTNVKGINEVTYVESNQPETKATVVVGNDFNIYNYKTSDISMKVANILASGGTIILTQDKASVEVKLTDEAAVLNYQLQQLEYLISKYNKVTGYYAKLAYDWFGNRQEAHRYFQSEEWKNGKLFKLNALDVLVPTLTDFEADRSINIMNWLEQNRLSSLWTQAAKVRVFKQDIIKDLPNQEVTVPVTQLADNKKVHVYDQEKKAPSNTVYWKTKTEYVSTYADHIEARIVNAWFYNHEEFRKPTQDELAKELEELREWFEQYKYNARRNKVARPNQLTVLKYERLEQLEIEVGTYLNDRLASTRLYG